MIIGDPVSLSCDQPGCSRTDFRSRAALDSHRRYQHTPGIVDPLGYPCRELTCVQTFPTPEAREQHRQEVHA